MQSQRETCKRFSAIPFPAKMEETLGIAIETIGKLPINGLRHNPENGTCGWFMRANLGEVSDLAK